MTPSVSIVTSSTTIFTLNDDNPYRLSEMDISKSSDDINSLTCRVVLDIVSSQLSSVLTAYDNLEDFELIISQKWIADAESAARLKVDYGSVQRYFQAKSMKVTSAPNLIQHTLYSGANVDGVHYASAMLGIEIEFEIGKLESSLNPEDSYEYLPCYWLTEWNSVEMGYDDEVGDVGIYVANVNVLGNLTHLYFYDDSLATFSDNLLDDTPPITIPQMATADFLYMGSQYSLLDTEVFNFGNIVWNLSQGRSGSGVLSSASTYVRNTVTSSPWNTPGWLAHNTGGFPGESVVQVIGLIANLNTAAIGTIGYCFTKTCLSSSNYHRENLATTINGVNAFWHRYKWSGNANQEIILNAPPYVVNENRLWIHQDETKPNAKLLFEMKLNSAMYEWGDGWEEVHWYAKRIVVGCRKKSRGSTFVGSINLIDKQEQPGVSVAKGTLYTFLQEQGSLTGRLHNGHMGYTRTPFPSIPIAVPLEANVITFTNPEDWYGSFRVFLRVAGTLNDSDAVLGFRVKVKSGDGRTTYSSIATTAEYQVQDQAGTTGIFDLGSIDIPTYIVPEGETLDTFELIIEQFFIAAATTGADLILLTDLFLIPSDEMVADIVDPENSDTSFINRGATAVFGDRGDKYGISTLIKVTTTSSVYMTICSSVAVDLSESDMGCYFLTMYKMPDSDIWCSDPRDSMLVKVKALQ